MHADYCLFFTECLNGQSTNCGTFCCPTLNSIDSTGTNGNLRDQCCRSQFGTIRSGCCSFLEISSLLVMEFLVLTILILLKLDLITEG